MPSHFKNVDITEVENLTTPISDLYTESSTTEESERKSNVLALTDVDEFRQIIKIKLKHPGKENVLTTIKELEKIDYIESAEPNYFIPIPTEPTLSETQITSPRKMQKISIY